MRSTQSWSQGFGDGNSASLLAQPAWPLTFRAPRLSRPPDCLLGRRADGGAPGSSSPNTAFPAPTLLSLSAPVCELINLSPFGKLERRGRVRVLLLGPAKTHCGLGAWGWEWGQEEEGRPGSVSLSPPPPGWGSLTPQPPPLPDSIHKDPAEVKPHPQCLSDLWLVWSPLHPTFHLIVGSSCLPILD